MPEIGLSPRDGTWPRISRGEILHSAEYVNSRLEALRLLVGVCIWAAGPREPFEVDPDAIDRSLRSHAKLQEALAAHAVSIGATPLSPGALDPDFDIAWKDKDWVYVAEVKSLTEANEVRQLRLGLGQVLHYQNLLERGGRNTKAILFIERAPADEAWVSLCATHSVELLWPQKLESWS
jgi:sugar phosphate isomerase/epimerase